MGLRNPPLVEVWMSFRFEPVPGAPAWTRERYQTFLSSVNGYPSVEEMVKRGVRVSKSRPGKLPKVTEILDQVMAVRAFTEDGLRAVQMTPDELAVNYLRGGTEPYPGFATLLNESMAHCKRYVECYEPDGVIEAALHYEDIVRIPIPENRLVAIDKYFTLSVQVPESVFGPFAAFEVKALVKPPGSPGPLEVVLSAPPVRSDDDYRPVHLEWHTAVRGDARMTLDETRSKLQEAHDRLGKCFYHAFTPEGWALFEPDEP